MGEVAAPDRERLLRSKKDDLSGIVASRKRKLRELYAICDNEFPIPQITLSNVDAPPTTPAEKHFLEVSDILQARLFDESNLPTRRQLRSSTSKHRSPIRKTSPDTRTTDASRKSTKLQRDGSASGTSRAPTPGLRTDDVVPSVIVGKELNDGQGLQIQRSTSKGSQTDLGNASTALVDIVNETSKVTKSFTSGETIAAKDLESERIRTRVESPPNSPGADPRRVLPISAEETSELPFTTDALGSNDLHHKAATVHLPSQEIQEGRLRESKRARQRGEHPSGLLSINLPPRDGPKTDPVSSPGSTVGAHSATTPVLHEASADTSPENDNSRYDAEQLDKMEDVQTPQEFRPTIDEAAEKEQHDRIQKAQIEVSRREILGEDLDTMEGQATSMMEPAQDGSGLNDILQSSAERQASQEIADALTKRADEVVEDFVDDQDDAIIQAPLDPMSGIEKSSSAAVSTQQEIPDSEEDQSPNPDATAMDSSATKDSLDSSASSVNKPAEKTSEPKVIDKRKSPASSTSYTPRRTPTTSVAPVLERMTTRVGSGALRHKSVSEILGQIPPPNKNAMSDNSLPKLIGESSSPGNSSSASRSATPQSPTSRGRSHVEKAKEKEKEKERSKLSTVVFPGPVRPSSKAGVNNATMVPTHGAKDDYFTDLFLATAIADKRGIPTLDSLITSAHKTITTSNMFVPIIEHQTFKILKRIYNLQSSHKWSLRQPKRSLEPIRPTTHWDVLLQEAKWMRTDFREERKWKMALAKTLATACAEWVNDEENRKVLQVNAVPPPLVVPTADIPGDVEMRESSSQESSLPLPELEISESDIQMDDFDEEPHMSLLGTVSPAAIFGLQDDDVVFGLRRSPTSEKLLNELPMYGAPLMVPESQLPTSQLDPDRFWRRPALPLSKYVEGRLELKTEKPPRKTSRFQHEDEDEDEDHVIFGQPGTRQPILDPESTEVALFNPEHKHIRDRIHSSHQFRPPSEFPMPQQSFFESRTASQWTWTEDDDLKAHVRKYSYNWSLISSLLTSKSLFTAGAERRTPWECFERWINLEGLPADMQKTHYFRTYTTRIDQANRAVMALAAQASQQQPNANGQIQPPPRRRPTTSVRVERRRNQKHLTLVDAMRKLAKKRETSVQKQQHAAGLAAMRKANEVPQARGPLHTPQDFSRLKHEREEQLRDRMVQMQQRQEASRRAALLQQRNATQIPPGPPNGGPQPQQRMPLSGGPMPPGANPNPTGQNLTVPGQNRPRQMPNQMPTASMQGALRPPQMSMNGVPSVPMHGVQGQLPLPNPALDVGLVARAQTISEQQRQAIRQQQHQGQIPGQPSQMHNSPPRMNGMPQPGFPMPNNMMQPYNPNPNGVGTPPTNNNIINTPVQGQAGSPRMGQPHSGGNNLSQVNVLERNLAVKYPTATPEQIRTMIQDHLSKQVQQAHQQQQKRQGLVQSAMNAAAGGNGLMGPNPGQQTPQSYAQMLRQQQELQSKQNQAQQQSQAQQQQQVANAGNVQNQGNGQASGQPSVPGNGRANGSVNGGPSNASGTGHAHKGSSGSVQSGGK